VAQSQVFEIEKDKSGGKSYKVKFQGGAIFLPSVAPQFGWNREQTLHQLIKKAGYKGKIDFSLMKIAAVRHQSSSCHVTHKEWLQHQSTALSK
jgi:AMMECR1 domain-containing protein